VADDVWLVVGLGNPGPSYAGNRHNAGFMVLDLLGERSGARFKAHKGRADVVEGRLAGQRAVLAKPKTYMNLSGGPTASLRDFFKVPVERVVVVHDEIDIPYGTLRLKRGGERSRHHGSAWKVFCAASSGPVSRASTASAARSTWKPRSLRSAAAKSLST
jgi:PTH1 family peptidyl-tRNA hydrolase